MKYAASFQVQVAADGRSPCGERGLKYEAGVQEFRAERRSPCGERGLKFRGRQKRYKVAVSLPVRGAWIEIAMVTKFIARSSVAPRAGSVD